MSGPESEVVVVDVDVEVEDGVGGAVAGESTFAAAAIALDDKERSDPRSETEDVTGTFFRIEPRRGAAAQRAAWRDERRDDDASAAVVEKLVAVVERESRMLLLLLLLLLAAPSRVVVGNARSWLQRRARRPRRIQRWRRPAGLVS